DRRAAQHRRSLRNHESGASGGGQNRAEQHPIPIHPSRSPSPPRAIQNKLLIAISESRKSRRNSVHYPVNAGSKVWVPGPVGAMASTSKFLAQLNKAQDMGRATKGCSALQSLLSWCRAGRAEFYFEPFCQLCPGLKWSGPFPFHGS